MSEDQHEEFINMPVPRHMYPAVIRLLADDLAGSPEEMSNGRVRGWTADELAILKHDLKNKTVLTFLDLAASRAGQWVTFEEVYTAAGRTKREAMGDLAGFTQRIKIRLKKSATLDKEIWPLETEWDERGSPRYRMPVEIAQWWQAA